ncbi:hypothetical protein GZ78_20135 [Endozoicomonas numazuensis]|uniref:Uncharacterized protein n=1 Tax=Endozoicomonas numazuensis TaxID=1137799 RepID=A0A081NES2_9GAMM|nr:hypothetical protein GZ78_20135 [Endozoicomonas numazuensis]
MIPLKKFFYIFYRKHIPPPKVIKTIHVFTTVSVERQLSGLSVIYITNLTRRFRILPKGNNLEKQEITPS